MLMWKNDGRNGTPLNVNEEANSNREEIQGAIPFLVLSLQMRPYFSMSLKRCSVSFSMELKSEEDFWVDFSIQLL